MSALADTIETVCRCCGRRRQIDRPTHVSSTTRVISITCSPCNLTRARGYAKEDGVDRWSLTPESKR